MEEILTNAFSTGDIKIIIVAVILYIVISVQRGNTKKDRDGTAEEFDKRVTLLENEVKRVKDLDLETKLAQIQTDLQWIKENLKK
jgi:hypothetical protein